MPCPRRSRVLLPTLLVMTVMAVLPPGQVHATRTTELGRESAVAGGLLGIESLLVARLTKRVREPHLAYVIFDTERVVRGRPQGRMLLPFPERDQESSIDFHSITENEIDGLREGGRYLLWVGRRIGDGDIDPHTLIRWKPLPPDGPSADAEIAAALEPFDKLDRNLRIYPWAAASHKDLFVQGCVHAYYYHFATPAEVRVLFESYVKLRRPNRDQRGLLHSVLGCLEWRQIPVPGELLLSVYRTTGDERDWPAPFIRAEVLERIAKLEGPEYDMLILHAVQSQDPHTRMAALGVLSKRRLLAAVPFIRADLTDESGEGEAAVIALARQLPVATADRILALCAESPRLLVERYPFLKVLVEHVRPGHAPVLRALDNPNDRALHQRVIQLLVAAGDPAAREELARLAEAGELRDMPYHDEPWLLRDADAYRPLSRRVVEGRGDGSNFTSAVVILRKTNDPALHELLVKATGNDWYHVRALQHLQEIARPADREVFLRFLDHDHPRHTACRTHALAGLARLGDDAAAARLVQSAWLAPSAYTRYQAQKDALPTFNPQDLRAAWERGKASLQLAPDAEVYLSSQLRRWSERGAGTGK